MTIEEFEALKQELKNERREKNRLLREIKERDSLLATYETSIKFFENLSNSFKKRSTEQDTYMRLMLEHSPDIIVLMDTEQKYITGTKRTLKEIGVDTDKLNESNFFDIIAEIVPEDFLTHLLNDFQTVVKNETELGYEKSIVLANGIEYIFTLILFPVRDETSVIIGVMLYVHDITELKRAVDEAEAANKAKTNFLATMSHEIRTPMNAIIGTTQIQMQKDNLPDEYMEALKNIYNSGNSLLGIINDILDMSKIETGKLELNLAEYDIPSLINDAVQINIIRIGSKSIKFALDIDSNLPLKLYGDELRLKQILNNLLSNAIKYTESGEIKLSVNHTVEDGDILLYFVVEDTGQGMTLENRARLFSEYTRFNAEANRNTEGTGLGLSISKKLIEMMDGTIWAESEYGKGSVFMVMIKQKSVDNDIIGTELAEQLCNFKFRGKSQDINLKFVREPMPYGKILVVDDIETNLYVAKGLLAPYGLNIETVDSGFAAIEKIQSGKVYDVIFMDHMMPKMDGIETTIKLRESGYKEIIIALTANVVVGQSQIFLENGFDGIISKPIDVNQLNNILNKYIRDKQSPEVIEAARKQSENVKAEPETKPGADSELLSIFNRDAKKSLQLINSIFQTIESVSDENLRLFIVNVHAMKSALANIGKKEVSNLADILEQAGKKQDITTIANETPLFIEMLQMIITEIDEQLDESSNSVVDSDPEFLCSTLKRITEACDEYDDQAAEEALAELKEMVWSKDTKDLLNKIKEHILHSEFEEASAKALEYIDSPLTLLESIEGFDAEAALKNMADLPELYMDTVKLSIRLIPETIAKMDCFIAKNYIEAFTIEVHGLKSVLKNIGATIAGSNAELLETAGLEDNGSYCVEYYPAFRESLIKLISRLKEAFPVEAVTKTKALISTLAEPVLKAKTAAGNFDCNNALDIIRQCAMFTYDVETDELLNKIIFALEAFEYEEALKAISVLEENINGI
ncbi:MAG: ATP-binding protein [Lachnospiraceae bacterium]|nr:ATP-binding protein [Lachnospiraceae bacterium]